MSNIDKVLNDEPQKEAPKPEKAPKPEQVKDEKVPEWAKSILEENKRLTKDLQMLKEMAGPNAIASWKDAQMDRTQKFVTFKKFNDKIVIGWDKLDMSEFNPKALNSFDENIMVTLHYLDGSSEKVNYIVFNREKMLVKAKLVESNQELSVVEFSPDVVEEYKLERATMSIPTNFLNR